LKFPTSVMISETAGRSREVSGLIAIGRRLLERIHG
jgi:hypothetical protein